MSWLLFRGDGQQHDVELPLPPPWRRFDSRDRATTYTAGEDEIRMVNAAIHLRRPLLITGRPGSGKSSLAHAVAYELGLGDVLRWSITSRTTLQDGLYRYDAIGRLQDANRPGGEASARDIGLYIRLGALGTALAVPAGQKPRVLLIDEIDKSDIDLPNDLLHVFEEGEFSIPELERLPPSEGRLVHVRPADRGAPAAISEGVVRCGSFPLVFFTSNGERDFPPAFYRRCLRLDMQPPSEERLRQIALAHLGQTAETPQAYALIQQFLELSEANLLATDQLLNSIYIVAQGQVPEHEWPLVREALLRSLGGDFG